MLKQAFSDSEVFAMIQEEVNTILEEQGHPARRISADDRLNAELGLKSLDLARLVVGLEVRTGADPFQELVPISSVRTVGDLREAYRKFFAGDDAAEDEEELLAVQRRAAARRTGAGSTDV